MAKIVLHMAKGELLPQYYLSAISKCHIVGFAGLPKLPTAAPCRSDSPYERSLAPSLEKAWKVDSELTPTSECIDLLNLYSPEDECSSAFDGNSIPGHKLHSFHCNLSERLGHFLARPVANRIVRLAFYTSDTMTSSGHLDRPILFTHDLPTSSQGAFQADLLIPHDRLYDRLRGRLSSSVRGNDDFDIHIHAELLPHHHQSPDPRSNGISFGEPTRSLVSVPISRVAIRVISDIDDTVKLADIPGGARQLFRNVFCKDLKDVVIKGMPEWYGGMWRRGARFHYVVSDHSLSDRFEVSL